MKRIWDVMKELKNEDEEEIVNTLWTTSSFLYS